MDRKELSLSHIKSAEIYLMHNRVNPDCLEPDEIARIQGELDVLPCEITFTRSEEASGKSVITEEGQGLIENFFGRYSITPAKAPPVIRLMAEGIAMKALSNGHDNPQNGFESSTELSSGVESEV